MFVKFLQNLEKIMQEFMQNFFKKTVWKNSFFNQATQRRAEAVSQCAPQRSCASNHVVNLYEKKHQTNESNLE